MLQYVLWALISILYGPILFQLYKNRWEFVDYTHAYFVLPASLLIVWFKRKELQNIIAPTQTCSIISFLVFLIGLLLFILGWNRDYIVISTFSLILVLAGMCGYLYGPKVLQKLTFPLAYLLLMVPPPLGVLDSITLPMRYGVSILANFILQSFHIPIHREGLLLYVGNQELFIAPACSGFRSLITFLSLALLYVYLIKSSLKKKIILLLSVFPLALLGNMIRVFVLFFITYNLGEDLGQSFLHQFSGILVFSVIIVGFLMIDKFYDSSEDDQ